MISEKIKLFFLKIVYDNQGVKLVAFSCREQKVKREDEKVAAEVGSDSR